MLASARAAAAEGQTRVRAAALAWERERDAADALARQIAEAEQLLVPPTYLYVGNLLRLGGPPCLHHRDHLA